MSRESVRLVANSSGVMRIRAYSFMLDAKGSALTLKCCVLHLSETYIIYYTYSYSR